MEDGLELWQAVLRRAPAIGSPIQQQQQQQQQQQHTLQSMQGVQGGQGGQGGPQPPAPPPRAASSTPPLNGGGGCAESLSTTLLTLFPNIASILEQDFEFLRPAMFIVEVWTVE